MNKEELLIEAILFAAGTRISIERIMELSKITEKEKVESILKVLQERHNQAESAFDLTNMGSDWKLTVKKQFLPIVEKIAPDAELPKSIIETLAILAWKAPMTQSELVKIRSNKSYDHIAELKDRGFIAKEKTGRTYVIKLTPKFYEYFDIDKAQVDTMMEKYKNADKMVPQKKVTDSFETKKEEEKPVIEEPKQDEVTIKHIKENDRKSQKEFFDKIEQNLSSISFRTSKVQSEIKELAPKEEEKPAGETIEQPAVESNGSKEKEEPKPLDNSHPPA